jgi:magnesium-transporting ATPase (P-type)
MPDLSPGPTAASPTGLTQVEASRRLLADGPNALAPALRRTPLRIALEVAREPMFQLLAEGDRIAADARLVSANDLRADESQLTGEAVPVGKTASGASGPTGRRGPALRPRRHAGGRWPGSGTGAGHRRQHRDRPHRPGAGHDREPADAVEPADPPPGAHLLGHRPSARA